MGKRHRMVYIWVRRLWDWAEEDIGGMDPVLQPSVHLWNSTFNLRYHAFRARVAQIAECNHSRVLGAKRAEWNAIPDGAIVLPVDDDDWFAPDAALALEGMREPAASFYMWESRWIEAPLNLRHRAWLIRRRLLPGTPQKWICTTNNYALIKGPGSEELLRNHMKASQSFQALLDRGMGEVQRLGDPLSVANRTLAGRSTLRRGRPLGAVTQAQLIHKFRLYKRLYQKPVASDIGWCRTYVGMMAELMESLELKRILMGGTGHACRRD